jgi:hypothetical protein
MKALKSGQWLIAVLFTVMGNIGHASMNEYSTHSNGAATNNNLSSSPDLHEIDAVGPGQLNLYRSGVNLHRGFKEKDSMTSNFGNLSNNIIGSYRPSFDATGKLHTRSAVAQSLTIFGGPTSHNKVLDGSSVEQHLLHDWEDTHFTFNAGDDWSSIWLLTFFNNFVNALDHNSLNGTVSFPFGSFAFSITPISTVSSVPLPGAVWLFGTSLFGIMAFRRKKQANLPV